MQEQINEIYKMVKDNNQNNPTSFFSAGTTEKQVTDAIGSVWQTNSSAVIQTTSGVLKTD